MVCVAMCSGVVVVFLCAALPSRFCSAADPAADAELHAEHIYTFLWAVLENAGEVDASNLLYDSTSAAGTGGPLPQRSTVQ